MPRPRCYFCGAFATTREHVPPRNLFPEAKDVEGQDFRKNLITVHSCDEHNSEKSHDDQFLMVSLAGIVGNNSIGYLHGMTKVSRAMRFTAGRLLDQVLLKRQEVLKIDLGNNRFTEIIVGTPDVERLKRCFMHVALRAPSSPFSKAVHRNDQRVSRLPVQWRRQRQDLR